MQPPCEDRQTSQWAWQGRLAVVVGLSTAALPPAAWLCSAPSAAGALGAQPQQSAITSSCVHRITEQIGLEGTFKVTEFQTLPRAGCPQQIRLLWAPTLLLMLAWVGSVQQTGRGQQHEGCCTRTVNLYSTWPQASGYKTAGENVPHTAGCLAKAFW